ncbi:MAG: hypothetical protein KDD67_12285 [Ignavibacteriae bacterium]|nr:hypothetical protein [Ignavibacteriota bacterium]MCB9217208.1 hypothetical protein [Ignavibacteria bacterium]
MTEKHPLTKSDLTQFIETTKYFRHPIVRTILVTESVKYIADSCAAYWLIDEIVFAQSIKDVAAEAFQCWTLVLSVDRSAILKCSDGNFKVVFEKSIPFTDFPFDKYSFYYADNVIMLPPSER